MKQQKKKGRKASSKKAMNGLSLKSQKKAPAKTGKQPKTKSAQATRIALTTLAVGATGILGYLGWKLFFKKKVGGTEELDAALKRLSPATIDTATATAPVADSAANNYTPPKHAASSAKGNDEFPLKKGSKGDKVRQLQQVLLDKYGKASLPKYGADGDFGSETVNALKKNGLPTSIDESTFNVLTQGGASDNLEGVATQLLNAASQKDFNTVLSLLKKIGNKQQYQQVNDGFKQLRLRGLHQTMVTGLLGTFSSASQKEQIRMEFLRMGLKFDGSKWSLNGFDGRTIVTTAGTQVWKNPTQSVDVPANMVLGTEITQRLDYTLFENASKYYLVKTAAIKYL